LRRSVGAILPGRTGGAAEATGTAGALELLPSVVGQLADSDRALLDVRAIDLGRDSNGGPAADDDEAADHRGGGEHRGEPLLQVHAHVSSEWNRCGSAGRHTGPPMHQPY